MANKVKNIVVVNTFNDFVGLMKSVVKGSVGAPYAAIYAEVDVKVNAFPTDGSERINRKAINFNPTKRFHVTYHFGEDYNNAMSKALGTDYSKGADDNRETIISNVLMRYKSTANACLIYMKGDYVSDGKFNNGVAYTADDELNEIRYASKASKGSNPVEYRTLSVKNVSKVVANGTTYELHITDWTYTPEEVQTPAYAVAQ